jgi:hypothetical protein
LKKVLAGLAVLATALGFGLLAPSASADPTTDLSLATSNHCSFSTVVAEVKNVAATNYVVRVDVTSNSILYQRVATATSGSTIKISLPGISGSYTAKLYYKSGADFLEVPGAVVTGQNICQIEAKATCSGQRVSLEFKNTGTARASMYTRMLLPLPQQGSYTELLPGEGKTRLVAVTLDQPYAITVSPVNGTRAENIFYFSGTCSVAAPTSTVSAS